MEERMGLRTIVTVPQIIIIKKKIPEKIKLSGNQNYCNHVK